MSNFFSYDASKASLKLSQVKKALNVDVAKELGIQLFDAKDEIIRRTQSGQGLKGNFPKYSNSYLKIKPSALVNLTSSGNMLRGIQVKVALIGGGILGTLFFSHDGDKARWNTDGDSKRKRPPRPFFGLTKSQFDKITNRIKELINGGR